MTAFVLIIMIICGVICAAIASERGRSPASWFFLGLILGIVGIVLVAVLPEERSTRAFRPGMNSPAMNSWDDEPQPARVRLPTQPQRDRKIALDRDQRRWALLKEVDPEVAAAAERVAQLGPRFEKELADDVFLLADARYLPALEARIRARAEAEIATHGADAALIGGEYAEEALREVAGYRRYLRERGDQDPAFSSPVTKIEPYAGEWAFARGGVRLTLGDGSTVLQKRGVIRRFPAGQEVE